MPRLARLDAPGVVHHVMIRGIERRNIFADDKDRDNLLERLAVLLPETKTECYAWALMPNHAHFLLRSGTVGLPGLMRRLLTGYAVGELGMTLTDLARRFEMTPSAVGYAVARGERVAKQKSLSRIKIIELFIAPCFDKFF